MSALTLCAALACVALISTVVTVTLWAAASSGQQDLEKDQ